jgi:anaerobic ribonucleoside-triphosphate reductase activating protein
MNIAGIKHNDIANGLGVRTTVFVSGCRRHCKGCHNPEAWDFHYGKPFTEELQREIIDSLKPAWIQGLTVCGGEPFEQENEKALTTFLRRVRDKLPGKDIWIYSGFTLEELAGRKLLQYADILVDGPFMEELKDAGLAFRGSRNQKVLRLKDGRTTD